MTALHPLDEISGSDRPLPASLFGYQEPNLEEGVRPEEGGFFIDLAELEYRLVDAAGNEAVTWTAVDVDRESATTDALLDFDQGLYAPSFTVPDSTEFGRWTIEWRFRVEVGGPQLFSQTHFTLVDPAQPLVSGPAQVQDMLDEGVPPATFSVDRIALALEEAVEIFEHWTGRFFEPRLLEMDADGEGGPVKQLEVPIVGLTHVNFTFTSFSPADLPIEAGDLRVYNRHIRNNLTMPDDRQDPRVEFLRVTWLAHPRGFTGEADLLSARAGFPLSQLNLRLGGVFGYTDWDGTPFGRTPSAVREAVMRIAMRRLTPLWQQTGGGSSTAVSGPITSEKTMDQAVTYANLAATGNTAFVGQFTGDPAIDQIILTFRRPPILRSA